MSDAPIQPNADPNAGDQSKGAGATPPADPPASAGPDLKAIPADQLSSVLENPNLFKLPRISEALNAEKELKALKAKQSDDADKQLAEQKKWEELASKRGDENKTLQDQLKTQGINQSLTIALSKENVVDLDAALKLIDRSKIESKDDGTVTGLDDAIKSLKTEKAYLFGKGGTPRVGAPSNPSGTPEPGTQSFKRSQITPEFYKANKPAIDKAYAAGQIENDGPAPPR